MQKEEESASFRIACTTVAPQVAPRILDPPAHRAAVDRASIAREAVLDAKQRHAHAVLAHDDVGEQRGGGERSREHLRRHRGRLDARFALGVDDLVFHARDDQTP
jgi:hypothetical protein